MKYSENVAITSNKQTNKKIEKNSFKYKKDENGLILTIHHTLVENNTIVRIRLVVGCFNEGNRNFLSIDNRGNVFIFDLAKKTYFKLLEKVSSACIARNIPKQPNKYLIGSKNGRIFWLDIEKYSISHSDSYSNNRISNISFPGIAIVPFLALVHSKHEAVLLNLETFEASHRLEFNEDRISLKFAAYIPQSDQIFTCFTNDSVHVWSGITLNTIRTHNPIRIRDRYLITKQPIEICLKEDNSEDDMSFEEIKEFSMGLINSFTFSNDGGAICFTTIDNYMLFMSTINFELLKVFKIDTTLRACGMFSKPNDNILLCQTAQSKLVVFDAYNSKVKLITEDSDCFKFDLSKDKELLYSIRQTGEVNIYCTPLLIDALKCVQNCVQVLRTAMSQPKSTALSCIDSEMKKILTRKRLLPILREYGQYPSKYRLIIWTVLLNVPCNKSKFLELVKMGTHSTAVALNDRLQLKDMTARRNLIKIFSCLSHWTKVFGYSDFLPEFIFPFVKIFPKNLTVCFEIIASILLNQCQLWFEFHPLEPLNYLGICENILNHFDHELYQFYIASGITTKEYAWALLSNGFSKVLDDEQWLCLWDHILSSPPYFMAFCAIAYSIVLKELIVRLTNREALINLFHEQNAIDFQKFIKKCYVIMEKCPAALHPSRYMKEFVSLPKGVYPKFQNYSKKWLDMQETELKNIKKERQAIDSRIRELEREETLMMEKLERGLQQEEHAKQMKDMEKQYQEILRREEERLTSHRKMLVLYQKELRQRKGKFIELIDESKRRRKLNTQSSELDNLLEGIQRERQRNEVDLTLAEEAIKDYDLNLLQHQYRIEDDLLETDCEPLKHQYKKAFNKISEEKKALKTELKTILNDGRKKSYYISSRNLSQIEIAIQELEKEFLSALKC